MINNKICKLHLFIFFVILVISIWSCKTTKQPVIAGFDNGFFAIDNIDCIEEINPDAMDSRVGKIECGCVTFNYDYGRYSYEGPSTAKEDFRKSFNTYYHTQFFKGMIDPKVNELFLDSVNILEVRKKLDTDPLMLDCKTCNTTAVITFLGETFFYPASMSEKQLEQDESNINYKIKGDYSYKSYIDDNGQSATYVSPVRNNFMMKNCLSLTVSESKCSNEEIKKIMNSVRITESIN